MAPSIHVYFGPALNFSGSLPPASTCQCQSHPSSNPFYWGHLLTGPSLQAARCRCFLRQPGFQSLPATCLWCHL